MHVFVAVQVGVFVPIPIGQIVTCRTVTGPAATRQTASLWQSNHSHCDAQQCVMVPLQLCVTPTGVSHNGFMPSVCCCALCWVCRRWRNTQIWLVACYWLLVDRLWCGGRVVRSQHRRLAPLPAPLALCLGSLRVPPQPSYMGTGSRRAEVECFKKKPTFNPATQQPESQKMSGNTRHTPPN